MSNRWKNLFHNVAWHPLAGVCWFVGFQKWGDWLHGEDKERPTVIDAAEVFDSGGTLALQIDGNDVLYLSKVENDEGVKLTDEQHQKIIDAVVAALKV